MNTTKLQLYTGAAMIPTVAVALSAMCIWIATLTGGH